LNGILKCVCCGETERDFLTLDHINGGGGQHRVADFRRPMECRRAILQLVSDEPLPAWFPTTVHELQLFQRETRAMCPQDFREIIISNCSLQPGWVILQMEVHNQHCLCRNHWSRKVRRNESSTIGRFRPFSAVFPCASLPYCILYILV
jgi:hypothetical protein